MSLLGSHFHVPLNCFLVLLALFARRRHNVELIVLLNRPLQLLQVVQNGLAEPRVEVVVKHFDDSTEVLELLELLAVRADRH